MLPCTLYGCQVTSSELPDEGDRTRLTRAAVAERALALADRDGPDALTIRKLATELGVTPMAIYWHFHSKQELLVGVCDQIWSEVDIEVDWSVPWTDQLRGLFTSLLRVLRAHPAGTQLFLRSEEKLHSKNSMLSAEAGLEVLRRAGLSPQDATLVVRFALWSAIMLVMSEPGHEFPDPVERAEEMRKFHVRLATLPLADFPRMIECAAPMSAWDEVEKHYEFGVDMFVGGVAAIAAARAKATPD